MSDQNPAQEAISQEIPEELHQKIGAIRALATTYNLLDKGLFNHVQAQNVRMSLEFIKALYESSVEEALQHPDADKSSALMELKANKEQE